MCLADTDIAILCGGWGTRIRPVLGDTPKVLAPVKGKPFLQKLLEQLIEHDANRIVLCTSYLSDKIKRWCDKHISPPVIISEEPEPTGTAGALRAAAVHLKSDPVMICNGDTILDVDLCEFLHHHRRERNDATKVVAKNSNREWQCAGFYLLSQPALFELCDRVVTRGVKGLDQAFDVFASAHSEFHVDKRFIDIGTPGGYRAAQ